MRLYYSIVDPYPAYRSDIAELFGVELSKLGLETEWFMASGRDKPPSAPAYRHQKVNSPMDLFPVANALGRLGYWLADLFFMSRQMIHPADAIQCRDKYLVSLLAIVVARLRGVPFFYWSSYPFPEHDRLAAQTKTGCRRWAGRAKASIRFFLLYKLVCRFADHVFVQSQRMKEDIHRYGVPLPRMTPVPMGVSARMTDWIAVHPVSIVPMRIVYLGTLASVRRLDMLLDAFVLVRQKFPKAQLMFVGDGDHPSERQGLVQKAISVGLEVEDGVAGSPGASVVFTGFVPMEEAWALTASAAVCVSPFYPTPVLLSTSPTKLVEYLALGRPVVCNVHPEQSKIIKDSGAGLCVAWSADAFANAISGMLLNPAHAEACASLGPAWVKANRTYPMIAKQVWAQYTDLMSRRR